MKNKKTKGRIIFILFLCIAIIAIVLIVKSMNGNKNDATTPDDQSQSQGGTSTADNDNGENSNPSQSTQPAGDYATRGESGNKTIMLADVKNTTNNTVEEKNIKVDLLSEDQKVIKTLEGTIGPVEAGQMTQLNIEVEGDFVDVYDYRIYE